MLIFYLIMIYDVTFRLLGLDMVVRDADCSILNPAKTSTVQLFWQHKRASEDIKKARVSKLWYFLSVKSCNNTLL